MTDFRYIRPPITEAVIEIRFSDKNLSVTDLEKTAKKFKSKKFYSHLQQFDEHVVDFNVVNKTAHTTNEPFFRVASDDLTQLVFLRKKSIATAQLAPYNCWDEFVTRFARDWALHRELLGAYAITRIGVRYVNRLDIPNNGPIVNEHEYINVFPNHPPVVGPFINYAIQTRSPIPDLGSVLNLNSAVVASPLPKHTAFVLDMDFYREVGLPQNETEVLNFLNDIRAKKNEVFEACITDKARELFK